MIRLDPLPDIRTRTRRQQQIQVQDLSTAFWSPTGARIGPFAKSLMSVEYAFEDPGESRRRHVEAMEERVKEAEEDWARRSRLGGKA